MLENLCSIYSYLICITARVPRLFSDEEPGESSFFISFPGENAEHGTREKWANFYNVQRGYCFVPPQCSSSSLLPFSVPSLSVFSVQQYWYWWCCQRFWLVGFSVWPGQAKLALVHVSLASLVLFGGGFEWNWKVFLFLFSVVDSGF